MREAREGREQTNPSRFLHRWRANGGGYKSLGSSCVRACSNYLFSTRRFSDRSEGGRYDRPTEDRVSLCIILKKAGGIILWSEATGARSDTT